MPVPEWIWKRGGCYAKKAAESFARANNKTTLEMTLTGKILDMATNKHTYPILKPFWDKASDRFAKGAEGVTDAFHAVKGGALEKRVGDKGVSPAI